jgi:HK97 family phage portal protein
MAEDVKQQFVDIDKYINAITREVDDFEAKGYEFTRDSDPTSANELWSEEVKAFADMTTIESLFFSEDWVFIVVDLIAQKISSQNLYVMKKEINAGVETVEFAADHPLNALIANPNAFQDYHSWMYNLVTQYILLGNGIVWYSHRLKQLLTLRTSQVQIDFDNVGNLRNYILYGGQDTYQHHNTQAHTFNAKEIIHVRRPNPVSLIWGLSPFVPGRKGVLFNRYSSDYLNSFYLKQATPGMIVEMDRQVNEATALRQLRTFETAYTGRRNQRRTMILPKGVTAKPSAHTIADQRITELINSNRESTLALLKVPKHEVGLQDGGSLGSEEYKTSLRNFWEATLKPSMRMIEGSLNKFFKKSLGENHFFQFDVSDVEALQENAREKSEIAALMLAGGATVNEVRAKIFDLAPVTTPGSDKPYVLIGQSNFDVNLNPDLSGASNPDISRTDEPDKDDVGDPVEEKSMTINPEDKLKKLLNGRKAGWLKNIEQQFQEIEVGNDAKHMEKLAMETLTAMGEVAADIVKKTLRNVKSAEIPSESELRKLIEAAFDNFAPIWEDEYIQTLGSSVEVGYDQQVDLILNAEDRERVEALRARDERRRRALLSARGLEGFAWMSQTQTESIMREIISGVEKNESVDQITRRVRDTFADPSQAAGRARTIARTETLTAVSIGQGASIENASQVIKGLRKAWLNMSGGTFTVTEDGIKEGDGRIRDQHLSMQNGGVSGEVVAHNETFSNGLRWPRDIRSKDASEVINCRCTVVMLTPGEDL